MKRSALDCQKTFKKQGTLNQYFTNKLDDSSIQKTNVEENKMLQVENVSMEPEKEEKNICMLEKPTQAGKRKFQASWLKELKWLEYKDGLAKCVLCNSFPMLSDQNSKVVQGFTGYFKLETFKKHGKSLQHLKCEEAKRALENPEDMPLARCIKSIDEKSFKHLHALFNACYYIAKNNRPYSDLPELLILLNKLDVTESHQYANEKRCQEFISYIARQLREELILQLKNCKYVSILIDGSTDKSDEEELICYVRYVAENKVKESFLSIIPLLNCSADGYFKALAEEFTKLGLEHLFSASGSSLVGIGTDGAAAMVGVHNGLVVKVREIIDYAISVHCVAHQLQLSVLQSVKNIKFIGEIDVTLRTLYKFYKNSPKRLRELKRVSEALEEEIVKLQYLHSIRWVSSKVDVLNALIKDWKSIVIHLESITQSKKEEANIAKGLLKKLKDFRFLITVHFLYDFLSIFKQLSLAFQKQVILLSNIKLFVERALNLLEKVKIEPLEKESKFLKETCLKGVYQDIQLTGVNSKIFNQDKANILEAGIQFLKERFINNEDDVKKATSVFDTFSWPSGKDLTDFGETEIKIIANHFSKALNLNENILSALLDEWYEFKVLGKGLNQTELFERCIAMNDRFPNLTQLLSIIMTLPVSTASCERGFSLMNIIKSKLRTNLKTENLCDLMFINLNGPLLKEFNPEKSIDKWYFSAKTQRHC